MFFRCFSPCRRFWCRRRCSFHQVFGCPPDGLNKFLIYLRKKHYCFSSELLLFQYLSNSSVNLELGLDIREWDKPEAGSSHNTLCSTGPFSFHFSYIGRAHV